jgi:hypothetical protein
MIEFQEFPKIARLSRVCTITEKLDGTNASIFIAEDGQPIELRSGRSEPFLCGSRTRWIFPESDNFGFARWAYERVDELLQLGPGHHFGAWWGAGIQRKYGLDEKRFSLFNVGRWGDPVDRPWCCQVVPVLYRGEFSTVAIDECLDKLAGMGSLAAPGFMRPEGVMVWHEAARVLFKKTLDGDGAKGAR